MADNVWSTCLPELLVVVFRHLDVKDKLRAALVCRSWRDAVYVRSVWKKSTIKIKARCLTQTTIANMVKRGIRRVHVLQDLDSGMLGTVGQLVAAMTDIEYLDVSSLDYEWPEGDGSLSRAFCQATKRLDKLKFLDMSMLPIRKHTFRVFAVRCPNLEELVMQLCSCSDGVPDVALQTALSPFSRLRLVNLDCCGSNRLLRLIVRSTPQSLEKLVLANCHKPVGAEVEEHITARLPRLRSLSLSNSLTEVACRNVSGMALDELRLDHVDGEHVGLLLNCRGVLLKNIKLLSLMYMSIRLLENALSGVNGGWQNLVSMIVCQSGIADEALRAIASITNLKGLTLFDCPEITVVGIGHLAAGQLSGLKTLDLTLCYNVKDWITADKSVGLISLENVSLVKTDVSGDGIEKLVRGCPRLTHLGVSFDPSVTDDGSITSRTLELIARELPELHTVILHSGYHSRFQMWRLWPVRQNAESDRLYAGCEGLQRLLMMKLPRLRVVFIGPEMPMLRRIVADHWPDVEIRDLYNFLLFQRNADGELRLELP